ncbi:hypothetical protein [Methanosarcina sp.]|uniref:hypothetical protein n=1 Tax=Methanosarcina sp. TaxID=2213 RepID=UPI003BB5CD5A
MTLFVCCPKRPGYGNNSPCAQRRNARRNRSTQQQAELIGKTPSLMFKVDDCKKTCDELRSKGVMIAKEPEKAHFGIQALIVDLYGNPLWLIEHPR